MFSPRTPFDTALNDGVVTKLVVEEGTQAVPVGTGIATISGDSGDVLETISQNKATPQVEPRITSPVIEPVAAPVKRDDSVAQVMEWDGPVKNMTVREALRDAMAEEMRVDDKIFIMGEEVAEYQGAYKVSQGLLDEFGSKRVIDTPITEHGFTGIAVGSG